MENGIGRGILPEVYRLCGEEGRIADRARLRSRGRGLLVITMHQQSLYVTVVVAVTVALTAARGPALAEDQLAETVKKEQITNRDRAEIKGEVVERVKDLAGAGTDQDQRERRREKLISTARTPGASKEGLDAYAEACAERLADVTTSDPWQTGFDAIWVLEALDNVKTAEALATGLKSAHSAVRYRAAKALCGLHGRLSGDAPAFRSVLRALGTAGAQERQEVVLRMIYKAIDFDAAVKDGPLADECAKALNSVFAGRLQQLRAGKRNETIDEAGYEIADACYPGASAAEQKELIRHMAQFLRHAVGRNFSEDTAEGYRPTLAELIGKAERIIHKMIEASKGRVPARTVSDALGSRTEAEQAARDALAELMAVLRGDPWNLP
ncbi:MAG: hypothetical protein JXQ75_12460 [Phycisphaerae bacterium]|nr:hypothetical protein [Phycisphaerae bacterium]